MARGGARPGAGRPKGTGIKLKRHNREQLERKTEKSISRADQRLRRVRARIFDGDAHTFLASVYRNEGIDLEHRIKAAIGAMPYERPRLAATSVTVRHISEWTDEELAAAIAEARAQAAALRGGRSSVERLPTGETRH
jgi:parvulin-like peptidyl-prolyl isomerase